MKQYWPWFFARLFLGGIFVTAGFLKLVQPVENFRAMIVSFGIIPYGLVGVIAHVMPWIEFLGGVALITGYFPRHAAAMLGCLSLGFVLLILAAWLHGTLPAECGCFGDGIHMKPYQMAILDTVNALIAAKLFSMKSHKLCLAA